MVIRTIIFLFFFSFSFGQTTKEFVSELKKITDVMVYDVTSPVAAARYYSYINLTSYEILASNSSKHNSFSNFSKFQIPTNTSIKQLSKFAYLYGMLYTGSKILPSGNKLNDSRDIYKSKLTKEEILFVEEVGNQILEYAQNDGFFQLNNLKRYTPKRGDGFWQPTPPAFMSAIEPNWNTMKTFFIKSSNQFLTSIVNS